MAGAPARRASDWLHCLAIGGILVAAFCLSSEGKAQGNPTTQPTQPQQQQQTPTPPPVVQQKVPDPDHYTARCDRPKDHDEADLCEQRRQAQAAEDSVWWAKAQTYLGILGAVLVLCSLWFTGWAAIAASKAVSAAQAALQSDRAWMTYEGATFGQIWEPKTGKLIGYRYTMIWKNTGRSPAINCIGHFQFEGAPTTIADGAYAYTSAFDPPVRYFPAGPNGTIQIERVIPIGMLENLDQGACKLFLYTRVEYNDVFHKDARHSEACFKLGIGGDFKKKLGANQLLPDTMFSLNVAGTQRSAN